MHMHEFPAPEFSASFMKEELFINIQSVRNILCQQEYLH